MKHRELILLPLLLILSAPYAYAKEQGITINFCYENKEFSPHFFGNSASVPKERPGALIETLIELDNKMKEISIKYTRQPWARCLNNLEQGEVIAVVGSYSIERNKFGRFPKLNNKLDTSRAFKRISTCLLQHKTATFAWQGNKVTRESAPVVAVPYGYQITKILKNLGFEVYSTTSLESAYKLLESKRVSASIIDCNATESPSLLTINPTPVRTHQGFLIFNNDFYQSNKDLSEKIWNTLKLIDKDNHYQKYQ